MRLLPNNAGNSILYPSPRTDEGGISVSGQNSAVLRCITMPW